MIGLSGGLIGPEGTPRDYAGQLAGTPVFLGCSDADPHIPLDRVHETARVLEALGGTVTERIYPGMGHGINEDEIKQVRGLLARFGTRVGSDGPDAANTITAFQACLEQYAILSTRCLASCDVDDVIPAG